MARKRKPVKLCSSNRYCLFLNFLTGTGSQSSEFRRASISRRATQLVFQITSSHDQAAEHAPAAKAIYLKADRERSKRFRFGSALRAAACTRTPSIRCSRVLASSRSELKDENAFRLTYLEPQAVRMTSATRLQIGGGTAQVQVKQEHGACAHSNNYSVRDSVGANKPKS